MEAVTVRQAGGTITLTADRRLVVEPWDAEEGREVCCLPNAVQVLRVAADRQKHPPKRGRD